MTAKFINVADLPGPDGRTWREINNAMEHSVPIGALVELRHEDHTGARLFVVKHIRDCDGTPLYRLWHSKDASQMYSSLGNWGVDSFIVIDAKGEDQCQ